MIKLKRTLFRNDGQVAIITAFLIISFVGMLALVIDMGALYEDRRELQSVADASALAGVQELPEEPATATARATEYVQNNRPDISSINIQIGTHLTANDMITVEVYNPDSPVYFGMVRFAGLYPAQTRDFNLTERQLPGGQRGTKISKQKALK